MGKASSESKKSTAVSAKKPATKSGSSDFNKLPMKTRVLTVLASQRALGKETVDKKLVATFCSVTNHHTFDTALSGMKKKGLIENDNGTMSITEDGLEEVGPDVAAPPADNTAAQDMMKDNLKQTSGKTKAMFDILTDGRAYSRAEIAEKIGMEETAKTFKTYISYLSKIVDKVDGDKIRLKDEAFPFGRPCDSE